MTLVWTILATLVILQLSVFYTTIYLHRTLTHRGMKVHPVIATLMHLHLTLFTGIDPREWVAVHRKHHHFSDKEGDPHSPYLYGLWHVFLGNAYYYRREAKNQAMVSKYTRDYTPTIIDKLPIGGLGIRIFVGWSLKNEFILASLGMKKPNVGFHLWMWSLRVVAPVAIVALIIALATGKISA